VTMLGFPADAGCGPCSDFEVAVTGQLQRIGIDVTIQRPTGSDYPGNGVFDPGSDIDLMFWGSGADFADPVAVLGNLQPVNWIGASNLDELTHLADVGGSDRVAGIAAFAHTVVDEQFLVIPTGFGVYPFFTSDRIGCGFVQPAIGAVDLLSLCLKPDQGQPPPTASDAAPDSAVPTLSAPPDESP
jgi:hypothetical protein